MDFKVDDSKDRINILEFKKWATLKKKLKYIFFICHCRFTHFLKYNKITVHKVGLSLALFWIYFQKEQLNP